MGSKALSIRNIIIAAILAALCLLTACSPTIGDLSDSLNNIVQNADNLLESKNNPSNKSFDGAIADDDASDSAKFSGSSFTVYFIDVGQADSILVECDGEYMLIDGGNVADSSLIYSFLEGHGIKHLNYIVATHAHEDHVGGLAGALNYASVGIAYSPVMEYPSRAFDNFVKYLDEQGVSITIPAPGDNFQLGSANVEVLGAINPSDNPNNTSIVLMVTFGETKFLFTGDAEREEEQDILDMGFDLSADILKVGHHGSDTSTIYPFLREIMPEYAIISCGKDNVYAHPHDNLLSRLRDADVTIFRTDLQGTIICKSDGKTVAFEIERNADIATNPTTPSTDEVFYIGNKNSLKFHRSTCPSLPAEQNRVIFDNRAEAIDAGYSACGTCKP